MFSDDRVLVAVVNTPRDWEIVCDEGWYRIPLKHAPRYTPYFDYLAFYFASAFGDNRWAVHYYAPVIGHELATRRDLFPAEPNHPRALDWYYQIQVGKLHHRLPPIVARGWRRVTFIVTTGERFEKAVEIGDLRTPSFSHQAYSATG